jgi:hypothetical protein
MRWGDYGSDAESGDRLFAAGIDRFDSLVLSFIDNPLIKAFSIDPAVYINDIRAYFLT